ncbi:MAG: hypothetical protein JEZ14_24705 [Marinilabiliaceae bacterium]|nr:hypothetical protein [Marinilabiliaceae bacterium]
MKKHLLLVLIRQREFIKYFGCGKGGNAIEFITEQEGVDFKEAVEKNISRNLVLCIKLLNTQPFLWSIDKKIG